MTSPLVICTLDGVLSDDRRRRRLLRDGRLDEYHQKLADDMPIWPTIRVLRGMQAGGCEIIIHDNRPDSAEEATKRWLKEFSVDYDWLILGPRTLLTRHLNKEGGQIFAAVVGTDEHEKFFRTHMHRPYVYRVIQEGLCYP